MARRLRRKDLKKDEFVETAIDFGQWLEENWMVVVRWAAGVAVIAVVVAFWFWYSGYKADQAVETLAQGMTRYQQAELGGFTSPADLEQALALFEEAHDCSGSSAAGKSALFYQGASLYRLGRIDEAIPILEEVRDIEDPATLSGLSGALLADLFASSGQQERAISLLQEMAAEDDPAYPPDQALIKLGRIYADAGNQDEARRVWQRIIDEHPQTAGSFEASNLLNNPG
jgi:tetratricopeptide (TPR) repeat protein